jgi:hypothetical protein
MPRARAYRSSTMPSRLPSGALEQSYSKANPGRAGQRSADVTAKVAALGGLPEPRWLEAVAARRPPLTGRARGDARVALASGRRLVVGEERMQRARAGKARISRRVAFGIRQGGPVVQADRVRLDEEEIPLCSLWRTVQNESSPPSAGTDITRKRRLYAELACCEMRNASPVGTQPPRCLPGV